MWRNTDIISSSHSQDISDSSSTSDETRKMADWTQQKMTSVSNNINKIADYNDDYGVWIIVVI